MAPARGTIPGSNPLKEVLHELEKVKSRFDNLERHGEISDVKYDQGTKRWYAKYRDEGHDGPYETDWRPWKSFSHGSISVSMPPRKGMKATLFCPGGYPEQGAIGPNHYGPDTPSPNDKPDEYFIRIQKPSDQGQSGQAGQSGQGSGSSQASSASQVSGSSGSSKDETLDLHWTKDYAKHTIGSTEHTITKDSQSIKTKKDSIDAETHTANASKSHTVTTKSHVIKTQDRIVTAQTTTIKSANYALNGKVLINC